MAKKILVITEGENTEPELIQKLSEIFAEEKLDIYRYKSSIHSLYNCLNRYSGDLENTDFLSVLRANENNATEKAKLTDRYTDIFLVFDFDPQDNTYSLEHLEALMSYFCESTQNGKLYINYPMVESFYHLRHETVKNCVEDSTFKDRKFSLVELYAPKKCAYKTIARYGEFGCRSNAKHLNKEKLTLIIHQQLCKGNFVLNGKYTPIKEFGQTAMTDILHKQAAMLAETQEAYVLNTCCFHIAEEYPSSLKG